jgi:hypothetical protein
MGWESSMGSHFVKYFSAGLTGDNLPGPIERLDGDLEILGSFAG